MCWVLFIFILKLQIRKGEKLLQAMNKGTGVGTGPTAAAAQKQKTMMQRVETDIANIVDNFTQLVNVALVNLSFSPTSKQVLQFPQV